MPTNYLYLSGTIKWAKVIKPDEKYQNWTIDLYPDSKSITTIKGSGLQLTQREDDDGIYYKFRRPTSKLIKKELVEFDPPEVRIVKDGNEEIYKGTIGNGSKVTVKVQVYDSIKGKAHRLDKIRVEELVEFKREENSIDGLPPF